MVIGLRAQLWLTSCFYVTVGIASMAMRVVGARLSLRRRCLCAAIANGDCSKSALVRASVSQASANNDQDTRPQQLRRIHAVDIADVHQLFVFFGGEAS